jgi:hypothetical protein
MNFLPAGKEASGMLPRQVQLTKYITGIFNATEYDVFKRISLYRPVALDS